LSQSTYEAGLETGIIVRPLASCFVMAPPLIITQSEIEELGRRLRSALDRVLTGLKPRAHAAAGSRSIGQIPRD
jgi:4-aminobutyrate--pyruvate transaminase